MIIIFVFRLGRIFIIKMRSCLKIQKGQKTVLIRPEDYDKYLIENAVVDTDEYKAVRMNIYKIEKQISKYIEGYVKSVSDFENADKKSFERKYKYSTLKYFHDILGIE